MEGEQVATIAQNDSGKFECRWIYLTKTNDCVFTKGIKRMYLPVAHGEGKVVFQGQIPQDQIVFKYADKNGKETAEYPANPNGAVENIAALCNKAGTVIGMMPHPERHVTCYLHPHWVRKNYCGQGEGLTIFKNAVTYVEEEL